jgi:3-(3-hydroxy-phenyl)propionate hydroxylase
MPDQAPVGIVGAGPVGLSLAVRLASLGIPSMILEAAPALRPEGSKACLIQGDVVEVLDKAGCGQEIADEGVMWHIARTYVRGRQVEMRDYPIPIGYGPFINISQYRIEQVLLEEVNRRPECTIAWERPVTAVAQDDDGLTVTAGGEQYRFRYLAACDGVRSTLRALTGVAWHGHSFPDTFLITDIQAKLPLAAERHFHYDPPFNPGRQLVMHAQPDDVWRIDWQLPPDVDIEAEKRSGDLDKRVRKVIGDIPYEIKWLSTYHFQQRIVEHFRSGRIFFAGDAAHALPPYGSRGMNSGIQDADNLAWKLAWVLSGRSGPELLDTYHTERYQATQENLRVTGATIRFMQPGSAARRWIRSILLRAALAAGPLARYVNSGKMAEPFRYVQSPIIDQAGGDQLIGAFAADLTVLADGVPTRLRRYFGAGFVAVHVTDNAISAAALEQQLVGLGDLEHVIVRVGGTAAVTVSGASRLRVVSCAESGSAAPYLAGRWYLVRPDGHIAAAGPAAELDALADVHARCSGAAELAAVTLT